MKWPWNVVVRTREESTAKQDGQGGRGSTLIFPSEDDKPTREFTVPPTLRGEPTVHTAPTREFPAHMDPVTAFAASDAEVDGAACLETTRPPPPAASPQPSRRK